MAAGGDIRCFLLLLLKTTLICYYFNHYHFGLTRRQMNNIFLIFTRQHDLKFHANCHPAMVSIRVNLHEMSLLFSAEKYFNMSAAIFFQYANVLVSHLYPLPLPLPHPLPWGRVGDGRATVQGYNLLNAPAVPGK